MDLRPYQQRTVERLFSWWTEHQEDGDVPILALPTAAGKSVICAEIVRQMFVTWPDYHPRTVVLVPSKELAEQNAEKLVKLLPDHISVGFVSASLKSKRFDADVIVATIGSIHKAAHLLGDIKCVVIDECHLVSSKGSDAGMYRQFLAALAKHCNFRTVGMTATPFRGNGIWLTDGDDPLFTSVASTVTMRELLDAGFIAPLVPPEHAVATKIDASEVGILSGDYKINELAEVVGKYLQGVANETVRLAAERNKWIAFTPSVANAEHLAGLLRQQGISAQVVCGETPADERASLIAQFKRGELRCLVTVLALSTGFDVPDVDCIVWVRPTRSPVLYVQGMGRGVRIAEGKTDCLVLDFTDTVERMGPVDLVKGRAKSKRPAESQTKICDSCGAQNQVFATVCCECGEAFPVSKKEELAAKASTAALLSSQTSADYLIDVTNVTYRLHQREGKLPSMRVDYWSGLAVKASEWVCFDHQGFAKAKAQQWWRSRLAVDITPAMPFENSAEAVQVLRQHPDLLRKPTTLLVRKNGKYIQIQKHHFGVTP